MNELETLKKKILYRASYRGTKEMDILLSTFVKKNINILDSNMLKDLEKFLSYEDEVIYNFYQKGISNKEIEKNSISVIFKNYKV